MAKHVVLKFVAVTGCADLLAPENAWHKRQGNVATVGCQNQNKTWHLKCQNSQWNGVVGSCNASGKLYVITRIFTFTSECMNVIVHYRTDMCVCNYAICCRHHSNLSDAQGQMEYISRRYKDAEVIVLIDNQNNESRPDAFTYMFSLYY